MCVPIVEPDVQLTEEDLKRMADAAGAGTTDTAGTTSTASGGRVIAGKQGEGGGVVTEKGNDASGGLTPAEQINQVLQGQIVDLQGENSLINQQIAAQAQGFQSAVQGILDGQKLAADALKDGFLSLSDQQAKALKAADDLRKNTGQGSRRPNYSLKLRENAQANRGGLSSTMLTGTGGVTTNQLTLGRPALLGA